VLGALDPASRSARLAVMPSGLSADDATLPGMAGEFVVADGGVYFRPRFPFPAGASYTFVERDGSPVAPAGPAVTIVRPALDRPTTTRVVGIHPSGRDVPRNLLRCYVEFSAPMSEGFAAGGIELRDADRDVPLPGALLGFEHELWDADRRRLTVLLDPGRIKRGLVPHQQAGYPLTEGMTVELVVGTALRDAGGAALAAEERRRYRVGPDVRQRVNPAAWTIQAPRAGTRDELVVGFDRPLDRALALRCLRVRPEPAGPGVAGTPLLTEGEQEWRFRPSGEWPRGRLQIVVDHRLEDLAGNSVSRVFDRDLERRADDPAPARPVVLDVAVDG
jgi:hypothetical protein